MTIVFTTFFCVSFSPSLSLSICLFHVPALLLHPQNEISLRHLFKLPQDLNTRALEQDADMENDVDMGHEEDTDVEKAEEEEEQAVGCRVAAQSQ